MTSIEILVTMVTLTEYEAGDRVEGEVCLEQGQLEGKEALRGQDRPQLPDKEAPQEQQEHHQHLSVEGKKGLPDQGRHLLLVGKEVLHEQELRALKDTTRTIAMNTVGGDEVTANLDLNLFLILSHLYQAHPQVLQRIVPVVRV